MALASFSLRLFNTSVEQLFKRIEKVYIIQNLLIMIVTSQKLGVSRSFTSEEQRMLAETRCMLTRSRWGQHIPPVWGSPETVRFRPDHPAARSETPPNMGGRGQTRLCPLARSSRAEPPRFWCSPLPEPEDGEHPDQNGRLRHHGNVALSWSSFFRVCDADWWIGDRTDRWRENTK